VRSYLALVWGRPERERGTISVPLARSAANRQKVAPSTSSEAREAITHYEVQESLGSPPRATLVRCNLETGRTHQIRAHMTHIGHPLLGDQTYGSGFKASAATLSAPARLALAQLGRQALHAQSLGFDHPRTGKPLFFEAEIPKDMAGLLTELRAPHI
jgi:23S rRNA pseudouridine1911/1915/1917 synthase